VACAHENKWGRYANFYAFVKNFVSAIVFQPSGAPWWFGSQRTNAARRFVDAISIVSFAFTLTQWLGSTIYEDYEDKGT
jgi:hypothetical protein